MNPWDAYRQAIIAEFSNTNKFQLVMPGHVVDIHFDAQGGTDTDLFDRYELVQDSEKGVYKLRVYKEDELLAIIELDHNGEWTGRYRPKNGYFTLRPIDNSRWRKLTNIQQFSRHFPVIPDKPEFYYRETPQPTVDLNKYEWDITQNVEPKKSEFAIALVGCNRPTYFNQVVDSLALNEEAHEFPIYCFLDLPEMKLEREFQKQQAKYLTSKFPQATTILRTENWGCGRNIIDARRQCFDKMYYKHLFVFEDDMVLSPTYMRVCLRLLEWGKKKWDNIGAVQGWNRNTQTEDQKRPNLSAVRPTFSNWWGYLMTKEAWDTMSEDIYAYEHYFLSQAYAKRPHDSIKTYFELIRKDKETRDNSYPLEAEHVAERQRYFDTPPTGQDSATMHMFDRHGWVRLAPIVNRGKYIGRQGIHMNEHMWKTLRYDDLTYHEFSEDATIETFTTEIVDTSEEFDYLFPGFRHIRT